MNYINMHVPHPHHILIGFLLPIFHLNLLVPMLDVNVTAPNTQIVGQSLTLECSVTTVRGITSRVDIMWSSDGDLQLKRNEGVSISDSMDNLVVYATRYTIPQLSTTDENRAYQCEVVINSNSSTSASGNVTLNVIGRFQLCINTTLSI